jgi:hypothetical protein
MDTEEIMASRMPLWVGLLTTSIVSLISMIAELPDRNDDDEDDWVGAQKWAVSVASISIAFATFGAIGSALGRDKFHGSKAESGLVSAGPLIICGLGFCIRQERRLSRYFILMLFSATMMFLTMCLLFSLFFIYRSLLSLSFGLLDSLPSTIPATSLPLPGTEAFEMPICISFLGEAWWLPSC